MAFRDNRTVINEAESLTGWNFSVNNNARSLISADPDPIQGTNHIGIAVSSAVEEAYFDLPSSISTANKEFYFWVLPQGIMEAAVRIDLTDTFAGVQAVFGDGSQRTGYSSGVGSGSTKFRYNSQDPNYVNFNIGFTATSGANPAGGRSLVTAAYQGTNQTDPNFTAITEIGVAFNTLADAKGGTENCFVDKIVYSDFSVARGDGITVFGTTTLQGVYASSRAPSSQAGIIREVGQFGSDLYGIQGRLYIGDSATGTENTAFTSQNDVITFETIVNTNGFLTQGGTGTTTSAIFGNRTGVGTGNNGVTIQDLGSTAQLNFSDPNVDSCGIYGSIIRDITASPILFDSAVGTAHEIFQTDFIGCAEVELGRIEANGCGFFNSVATGADTAATKIIDVSNLSNLFFSSGGTGHAISIDSATTNQSFTFNNFTYSGYAATTGNTGNEVLINNSGQPITVVVSGGNEPTVDSDGVRGVVTVQNNITVTISGLLGNTEVSVLENPSPYTQTLAEQQAGSGPVSLFNEDFVSAVTGTDIEVDTNGTANVIQILSSTTDFTNMTGLGTGDFIRVTERVAGQNLRTFDTFEVQSVTANTIDVVDVASSTLNQQNIIDTTGGTITVEKIDASYTFSVPNNEVVDILLFRVGSLPILLLNQTISSVNNSFPVTQTLDRNFEV